MLNFLKNPFGFIKNLIKDARRLRCANMNHRYGAHIIIETTPKGDWEEPRCGQQIRPVVLKCRCNKCGTVFIKDKEWDWRKIS